MTHNSPARILSVSAAALISVLLFWASFAFNAFHVAPAGFFWNFQRDSEALVIGKIVQAREEGLFASRYGLGRYAMPGEPNTFRTQQRAEGSLLTGVTGKPWQPYASEIGLQGFGYALLDRALFFVPLNERLVALRSITALLSAVAVTGLLVVVCALSGPFVSIPVGIVLLTAPWFITLGNNLYYALYLWFLPPIVIGIWLLRNPNGRLLPFAALATVSMLPKFVAAVGFGWAPTLGVMAVIPICLAYGSRIIDERRFLSLVSAALAAFVIAGAITFASSWVIIGDLNYLFLRFGYRAGTLPCIAYGADGTCLHERHYQFGMMSPLEVLRFYFFGNTHFIFGSFWQPLLIGAVGWALLFLTPLPGRLADPANGLKIAFPVALVGPLFWHLVMSQHSLIHLHVNYFLWYLPAIPLGFACATVAGAALLKTAHMPASYGFKVMAGLLGFLLFSAVCILLGAKSLTP